MLELATGRRTRAEVSEDNKVPETTGELERRAKQAKIDRHLLTTPLHQAVVLLQVGYVPIRNAFIKVMFANDQAENRFK